jgi:hypothetical protein
MGVYGVNYYNIDNIDAKYVAKTFFHFNHKTQKIVIFWRDIYLCLPSERQIKSWIL